MSRTRAIALTPLAILLAACGSSQTPHPTTASSAPPPSDTSQSGDESPGGIVIEGQLGLLTAAQLRSVLDPATPQLAACFNDRVAANSYLAGRIELKFRIGADGTPLWVIPLSSTIGDRPTEQCMIQRAMALRFPRPRGGETETTYPLEFTAGDDARPATEWPASRIEHVASQHRAALQRCTNGAAGPIVVTLYAAPHGTVATAGVSAPNQQAAAAADCIVHEVTSWHVPDPGSWYARTTLTVP